MDGRSWIETARRIEGHGYDIATMPDHFDVQLAPMPALQAVLDKSSSKSA